MDTSTTQTQKGESYGRAETRKAINCVFFFTTQVLSPAFRGKDRMSLVLSLLLFSQQDLEHGILLPLPPKCAATPEQVLGNQTRVSCLLGEYFSS